jgi:rhamnosyltransferase
VVVLYRPPSDAAANIAISAAQVDHVFAIDNTETSDPALLEALEAIPNLTYAPLGDNLGIAAALNAGVERARDSGHTWALTMDQDSTPEADMVAELASCAGTCDIGLPVGIVAPMYIHAGKWEKKPREGCEPLFTVMTSGNLLSVDAWEKAGRFDEALFIDQVDHDLCLRMHRSGYAIVRMYSARLLHRLGAIVRHTFPVPNYVTHHSAIRRYYITRNRFEVSRRFPDFPEFRKREMRLTRKELVKIVLYEEDKREKLLMSWRGYRDYRRGVLGRYSR